MKGSVVVLGLCGFVLGLALLDLQVGLRGPLPPLSEQEMAEGVAKVLELKQAGDVLVHSPLFTMAELKAFGTLRARPDRPRPQIMASRRVVLLDRVEATMYGLGEPKSSVRVGEHLEVKVYEPSGNIEVPVFDLITQLDAQTLQIERPVGKLKSRCTQRRHEGGWACPGEADWLYAAPRTLRIGGKQEECVWAHPTNGGAVVFNVPAPEPAGPGRELVLELAGGLADDAVTGTPTGAAVYIDVRQGTRKLARHMVPNRVGWHRVDIKVASGQPVRLSITTAKDGRRHHCINVRVLERAQEKS